MQIDEAKSVNLDAYCSFLGPFGNGTPMQAMINSLGQRRKGRRKKNFNLAQLPAAKLYRDVNLSINNPRLTARHFIFGGVGPADILGPQSSECHQLS
jgi:hypothetical protein